jgi:hypothetical protein
MRKLGLWLTAVLCLGCAGPAAAPREPTPSAAAPLAPAAIAPEAPPGSDEGDNEQQAPECESGAVRFSDRACALRRNGGFHARSCVGDRWQQSEACHCRGVVEISDARLRHKIAEELEMHPPLEASRVAAVRVLDLKYTPIKNLEGLECFHGLQKLVLWQHEVDDLSPLEGLGSLSELTAVSGRVRDLSPLATLSKLEKLSLSSNRILDLAPLRSLTGLTSLSFDSNCVTDLAPVQGMSKLTHLGAGFNYIHDLSPLESMVQLEILMLSGNYFADLTPLSNLYELHVLSVDSNGLRDISALTELKRFHHINIQRNSIDCDAQAENIRRLEEHAKLHGGEVFHDCGPKARRARRMGIRDPLSQPVVRNKARDPRCAKNQRAKP